MVFCYQHFCRKPFGATGGGGIMVASTHAIVTIPVTYGMYCVGTYAIKLSIGLRLQ